MRLNNKAILITDGMDPGAILLAKAFAAEGARVTLNLWPPQAQPPLPEGVRGVSVDPTDPGEVSRMVREVFDAEGRLDILLHNNNEVEPMALETASDAQMERALAINAGSAFYFAQAAGKLMRHQPGSKMIFLSSIHGDKPTGCAIGYSMAKGAVQMLNREIALDLSAYQVQSILVEMGGMAGDDRRFESDITPLYDDFSDKIPGHRPGSWEELLPLLLFVASDECTMFNGETLRADRGFVLHYMPRSTYEEQGVEL